MWGLGDLDAAHLAKVALAAPLFLVLPGYLLLRLVLQHGSVTGPPVLSREARGTSDDAHGSLQDLSAPSFLERWFLHLAISVGVVAAHLPHHSVSQHASVDVFMVPTATIGVRRPLHSAASCFSNLNCAALAHPCMTWKYRCTHASPST